MFRNVKKSQKKYRITELLTIQYGTNASKARRNLCEQLGIHKITLSRDENLKQNDQEEIKKYRLISYANFFGVTLDEMLTPKAVTDVLPHS